MAAGEKLAQQDLSGGMFPSLAPELIPPNGAWDITNGLLDEQGVVYRRGGSTYLDLTPRGVPRMLWSGYLKHGGQQTLLATDAGTFRSGVSLGFTLSAGLTRAQVFGGMLYLPGGTTYDGEKADAMAEKRAFYASAGGRLLAGEGSRVSFSQVPNKEGEAPRFENTLLTPLVSTAEENPIAVVSSGTGITVGMSIESEVAGIAKGTTIIGVSGTTIELSAPATVTHTAGTPSIIGAANYHEIPGGVQIIGMEGLRTSCVVFTTEGIWVIGGLNHNLTDEEGNIQQTLDRYSADAVLWGNAGLAGWSGGLVVPCRDDVWLMELGVSSEKAAPFVKISEPVSRLYRGYVAAGYTPGAAAVYRGHYFLPILSGSSVVDVLVCALDHAGRPWTHLAGSGAAVAALTSTDQQAALVGASAGLGRLLKLSYFEPSHAVETDADGVWHPFSVTYRDIATGNMRPNLVRKARLRYQLSAPPGTKLSMQFGETVFGGADWGEFDWGEADWTAISGPFSTLVGEAPPDPAATSPFAWPVHRKVRYARVKVSLAGPASTLSLRSLELFVRLDGKLF